MPLSHLPPPPLPAHFHAVSVKSKVTFKVKVTLDINEWQWATLQIMLAYPTFFIWSHLGHQTLMGDSIYAWLSSLDCIPCKCKFPKDGLSIEEYLESKQLLNPNSCNITLVVHPLPPCRDQLPVYTLAMEQNTPEHVVPTRIIAVSSMRVIFCVRIHSCANVDVGLMIYLPLKLMRRTGCKASICGMSCGNNFWVL